VRCCAYFSDLRLQVRFVPPKRTCTLDRMSVSLTTAEILLPPKYRRADRPRSWRAHDVLSCARRDHPAGMYTVRGKAWSGTGPVTQVHVSLTGEGDWHRSAARTSKGPYQWQDWSFDWEATTAGRHTLRARAADAAGNVQPDVPPWNRLGYGNNAVEACYVDVR
jgi:ribosomal protein S28E/S33